MVCVNQSLRGINRSNSINALAPPSFHKSVKRSTSSGRGSRFEITGAAEQFARATWKHASHRLPVHLLLVFHQPATSWISSFPPAFCSLSLSLSLFSSPRCIHPASLHLFSSNIGPPFPIHRFYSWADWAIQAILTADSAVQGSLFRSSSSIGMILEIVIHYSFFLFILPKIDRLPKNKIFDLLLE